jgi:hypothetical protein
MTDHGERDATCHCGDGSACTCDHRPGAAAEAAVTVTINPEARVSVSFAPVLLPPIGANGGIALEVAVLNQALVTLQLEAVLFEPRSAGVTLEFSDEPLSGHGSERRVLNMTVDLPGLVDITIGFRLAREKADLGGRDRFHFLFERDVAPAGA